jgi:transcription elongation GreA/GreB family factor
LDKSALRTAILARLEAELALQTAAAEASRDDATDADSRAEGKFDMRGQSSAYLAAGQAQLATEIAEALTAYQALSWRAFGPDEVVALGALTTLEARGQRAVYFLGPARGGLEVEIGGVAVTVITVASSLGRQLLGRRTGETLSLPGRTGPVMHTVILVE